MPLDTRSRVRTPYAPALDLPPPFRLINLREAGDAFSHATAIADDAGAGTLVFVGRFDLVEFALVVEPDEPLKNARRVFYAGMAALANALAVHAPPEKLINFDWPGVVFVDGGVIGGGRLGWPQGAAEDAVPKWLVFGAMVRTAAMEPIEPGLRLHSATLEEEGFEELDSGRLVESFARHFMVLIDTWQERGFEAVAPEYLSRLILESGVRRAIDDNGDLMARRQGKTSIERRNLAAAVTKAAWLDPETRMPRL